MVTPTYITDMLNCGFMRSPTKNILIYRRFSPKMVGKAPQPTSERRRVSCLSRFLSLGIDLQFPGTWVFEMFFAVRNVRWHKTFLLLYRIFTKKELNVFNSWLMENISQERTKSHPKDFLSPETCSTTGWFYFRHMAMAG